MSLMMKAGLVGALAFVLVCSLPALADDAVDAPYVTTMVEGAGGVPIAVTAGGKRDGPGIVFVHGFLASTLHWRKQMSPDLGAAHRLVFIDMRGHGASGKPWKAEDYLDASLFADDIAAAIAAAGLEKPVLVGWSYGGLFIMDYVRKYGTEAVSGIVLAGSTAGLLPPPPPAPDTAERRAQIERSRSANLMTLQEWTGGFVDFLTRDGALPSEEVETLRLSAMLVPHYVRRALRERPTDNTDMVEKLNVPVLLISGAKDVSAKPGDMKTIAGLLPQATLRVYDAVGPMSFWYESERFNNDVASFSENLQ